MEGSFSFTAAFYSSRSSTESLHASGSSLRNLYGIPHLLCQQSYWFIVQREKLRHRQSKQLVRGMTRGPGLTSIPCPSQPPHSGVKTVEHKCASICFPLPFNTRTIMFTTCFLGSQFAARCLQRIPRQALLDTRRGFRRGRAPPSSRERLTLWERTRLICRTNIFLPALENYIYKLSTRFLKAEKISGGEQHLAAWREEASYCLFMSPSLRHRTFSKEAAEWQRHGKQQVPGFQILT